MHFITHLHVNRRSLTCSATPSPAATSTSKGPSGGQRAITVVVESSFGWKLNRGLSVIDSYMLLKERSEVTEDDFLLACVLGWCVEWVLLLIHLLIIPLCLLLRLILIDFSPLDNNSCSFKHVCCYWMISRTIHIHGEIRFAGVGLRGVNDGVLPKCHILLMIKKYFREQPYFINLLELWNEVALQTSLGQMLDLIGTHSGADNLAKYSIEGYRRIVKYKTSYYSFNLPVTCALLLSGEKLENFSELKDILTEMGIYFQIQDDYLDCFADPNAIGKIGTDIEDHKCSWLIVQAFGHADSNQLELLHISHYFLLTELHGHELQCHDGSLHTSFQKNYGKKDLTSVSKMERTYKALELKDMFSDFERRCYNHLVSSIEAQQDRAAQGVLKSFLKKIHQRKR